MVKVCGEFTLASWLEYVFVRDGDGCCKMRSNKQNSQAPSLLRAEIPANVQWRPLGPASS